MDEACSQRRRHLVAHRADPQAVPRGWNASGRQSDVPTGGVEEVTGTSVGVASGPGDDVAKSPPDGWWCADEDLDAAAAGWQTKQDFFVFWAWVCAHVHQGRRGMGAQRVLVKTITARIPVIVVGKTRSTTPRLMPLTG